MAQEALDRLVVISTGWRVERDALRERIVALTEGDDSLAARADKAEAEVERLTKALREIIFGIERHDDTDGGWMPMNATEVVAIARRALRPTHNTGEGE
jgi:hypothetical protein